MSHTYAEKKRSPAQTQNAVTAKPDIESLSTGAAAPAQGDMGHRVDLPDAMREKMENAFGADLSAVRLYESQAVDDAGANAVTQGNNIAFAPGMLDFTSYGGQALLGHEISHVVSQARGEVTGSGFLNDHALEARADREGAMAAAGQQIAMPASAMSPISAASAAGPMQASKKETKASNRKLDNLHRIATGMQAGADIDSNDLDYYDSNIRSLTPKEIDMIGKRMRTSLRNQYSEYQSLTKKAGRSHDDPDIPSIQGGGVSRVVASSMHGIDQGVYSRILDAYADKHHFDDNQRAAQNARIQKQFSKSDFEKFQTLHDKVYRDPDLDDGDSWEQMQDAQQHRMRNYYNYGDYDYELY